MGRKNASLCFGLLHPKRGQRRIHGRLIALREAPHGLTAAQDQDF